MKYNNFFYNHRQALLTWLPLIIATITLLHTSLILNRTQFHDRPFPQNKAYTQNIPTQLTATPTQRPVNPATTTYPYDYLSEFDTWEESIHEPIPIFQDFWPGHILRFPSSWNLEEESFSKTSFQQTLYNLNNDTLEINQGESDSGNCFFHDQSSEFTTDIEYLQEPEYQPYLEIENNFDKNWRLIQNRMIPHIWNLCQQDDQGFWIGNTTLGHTLLRLNNPQSLHQFIQILQNIEPYTE